MLYAHQERHLYLKEKDRVKKQLQRQRPLSEMELEKRKVKERVRKRLHRQKQKELKPQSQSTPDYIETRKVKKNGLRRQKRKLLHLKLPSLIKKPAAVDSPLEGFDDSDLSCCPFICNNMSRLSKKTKTKSNMQSSSSLPKKMNTSLTKCIGINLSNPVNMAVTLRSDVIEKEIETFFLREDVSRVTPDTKKRYQLGPLKVQFSKFCSEATSNISCATFCQHVSFYINSPSATDWGT